MLQKLSAILLALLPSFIQVPTRRLVGQKIGAGSKIKFGTIILANKVEIGKDSSIGPFSFIKCDEIKIGDKSKIKSISILNTRIILLHNYVHIAPLTFINSDFNEQSILEIDDHSRTFPFSWIEPGEGIYLGKNVSVGGHTLLFTHGSWANYLEGAPVSFGPIRIEDNVWLPMRVFILPNVNLGKNVIVAGNSVVNKSFPANTLIAGSPARIIKENIQENLSDTEQLERLQKILTHFSKHILFHSKIELIQKQE